MAERSMVVIDTKGTHTCHDQGYSPQHCAHLFVCAEHGCHKIALRDEFIADHQMVLS